jgi:hypothetical protein
MNTYIKEGSKWVGQNTREEFTILAIWNPNKETDPWIKYQNQNDSEFTCRLEAFLSRFSPLTN